MFISRTDPRLRRDDKYYMDIKKVLQKAVTKLNKAKIENPYLDAELLLSHVLNKTREYLLTHNDEEINLWQKIKFDRFITKRSKGMPVAYLVGHKSFYGLDFIVNKNVLVPRPETELMVESIINYQSSINNAIVIDVGTGTGCIAISLVKEFNSKCFATDISKEALKVAKKNAKNHDVEDKITFLQGNLLEPFLNNHKYLNDLNRPLVIAANLPYLTPEQVKNSSSIQKEPKLALIAGEDGLDYYRELFQQLKEIQASPPISYILLCEIDPSQVSLMSELIKKELLQAKFEIKKDLAGLGRLVVVKYF